MENIHETHFAEDPQHCVSSPLFEKNLNINIRKEKNKNNFVALNHSDLLDMELPSSSHIIDLVHDLLFPQSWWLSSNFGKVLIKLCLGKQLEHLISVR